MTRASPADGSGDHTTSSGPVTPTATRDDVRLPSTKAASQAAEGAGPSSASTVPSSSCTTADHSAPTARRACSTTASHELVAIARADEDRGRLEGVEPRIVEAAGERPHLLDVDAVHLLDLLDEEVDERRVGQVDHQLVDRPTGASLEDLDADDLAPHRSDPAGDLPERTWAVGQPEADDEGVHAEEPTDGV